MNFFETIIFFFRSDFSGIWIYIKTFSFILSIGLLIGIIYSIMSSREIFVRARQKKRDQFSRERETVRSPRMEHWESISQMFKSNDLNKWRIAIIDADTMLEELVTEMGHQGDTFGEKLKSIQRDGVPWTDTAWDVHLLRNKLAHEGSRYPLNDREAFRAYKIYENILVGTGFLAK